MVRGQNGQLVQQPPNPLATRTLSTVKPRAASYKINMGYCHIDDDGEHYHWSIENKDVLCSIAIGQNTLADFACCVRMQSVHPPPSLPLHAAE